MPRRLLLHFAHHYDLRWEVVAVAVEERSARVGAQRIAFACAFVGLQEVHVEHAVVEVGEVLTVALEEVVADDDLVEQVPGAVVGE